MKINLSNFKFSMRAKRKSRDDEGAERNRNNKGLWGLLSIAGVFLILGGSYSMFSAQTDASEAGGLATAMFGAAWLSVTLRFYVKSISESKK